MGYMRVLKRFEYRGQRGERCTAVPGSVVDILTTKEMDRLVSGGFIAPVAYSQNQKPYSDAAGPMAVTKRIGIWLKTTTYYSGGRVYMYQVAHCLAEAGCEVYLITNLPPMWAQDYPSNPNLRILTKKSPIPSDLDIVLTDSKDLLGEEALEYKEAHPNAVFVCMNFESENWLELYVPEYSKQLTTNRKVFAHADLFLACSHLSGEYLKEWMEHDNPDTPCEVIRPVVNSYALDNLSPWQAKRPFAVWTARSPEYKGGDIALEALMELDKPFDLVTFGQVKRKGTREHKIIPAEGLSDAQKYSAMKAAHFVLAPSLFEGYGMVPREALASGTPCVVYDLPVLRQEYGDQDGLHYIKWNDRDAFKAKVKELAGQDKPELDSKQVQSKHSIKSMMDRIDSLPYFSMRKPKITVSLLSYWGFLPQSLESIAPYADQIIICHGRVAPALDIDDGSLDRIMAWIGNSNCKDKVQLEVRDKWESKEQMREFAARKATGNRFIVLDGDEIWVGLDKWLEAGITFGSPRFVHLWHGPGHWIHDAPNAQRTRWGKRIGDYGTVCPVYRWSLWRPSYNFQKNHVAPTDVNGRLVYPGDGKAAERVPEAAIYHLGHALPPWLASEKFAFYRDRDGQPITHEVMWMRWNGALGQCGDGVVEEVHWGLPDIVARACADAKKIKTVHVEDLVEA